MEKALRSSIIASIKRNRFLYYIYYGFMSALINIIRLFVKTDDHLILFVSFGGRRCTDSPRAIYDYMRNDARFRGYKLVWGVVEPKDFPEIDQTVKIDTLKYYITSLKARCWITNVTIQRGLNYKGKHTFYLYTGHGSPIKKCGNDVNNKKTFRSAANFSGDACLAQSEFEKWVRGRTRKEAFLTGAPTNDILANYDYTYRKDIRIKLGISEEKKAILYAPTFREYRQLGTFDMPEVDFKRWHNLLGEEFVILYRAHPISGSSSMANEGWFIDVTKWEDIEPLMIASDILISDYSGLITDYSIMHKPIYLWTYDYEQYNKIRGLYFDVREVLPYAEKEETLLSMIKEGYTEEQKELVHSFQQKYATVYGSATLNAVDVIYDKITKR